MVQPERVGDLRALSGDAEQPAQIGPGPYADRVAGQSRLHDRSGRRIRGGVRLDPDAAQRIPGDGPGEDQADLRSGREPAGCADQGAAPRLGAADHQQHEGERGPVPGGGDHRGVPGGPERTGLSHHLREPGVPAGSGDDVHRDPVPAVGGPVSGDRPVGKAGGEDGQCIVDNNMAIVAVKHKVP